jgi:hypothetical protein
MPGVRLLAKLPVLPGFAPKLPQATVLPTNDFRSLSCLRPTDFPCTRRVELSSVVERERYFAATGYKVPISFCRDPSVAPPGVNQVILISLAEVITDVDSPFI